MTHAHRISVLAVVCAAAIVGVLVFLAPIPQDPAYHAFADQRAWLGIPHFGDVLTNAPFTLIGLWGAWQAYFAAAGNVFAARTWRLPYGMFFLGLALVGPGSAFYHWSPDNDSLVWDRIPMTSAFMALLTTYIADRVSLPAAKILLWPLVVLGIASVWYWHVSDDLRPYGMAQFLTAAIILLICWLFAPRAGLRWRDTVILFTGYTFAKVFEAGDGFIWSALGPAVSGHNLKHLAAAASCLVVVSFVRRAPDTPG